MAVSTHADVYLYNSDEIALFGAFVKMLEDRRGGSEPVAGTPVEMMDGRQSVNREPFAVVDKLLAGMPAREGPQHEKD